MLPSNEQSEFYHSLSSLEQAYWHRFFELFQLVQPQKPEKGIKTLILRARREAEAKEMALELALAQALTEATERTHRRVALLNQCQLSKPASD